MMLLGGKLVQLAVLVASALPSVSAITPEQLLSANRYGAAKPNPAGVSLGIVWPSLARMAGLTRNYF
jgi:hypothetical protein